MFGVRLLVVLFLVLMIVVCIYIGSYTVLSNSTIEQEDTTPPTITSTLENNSYFRGGTINIYFYISDNESGLSLVQVYQDGALYWSDRLNGEQSYTVDLLGLLLDYLSEGMHNFTAIARDVAGNIARLERIFYVDRTRPSGFIIEPAPETLHSGTITVRFNYTDNLSPLTVTLRVDGDEFNVTDLYSYDVDTRKYPDGELEIILYIEDRAGNSYTISRTIMIDNSPPLFQLISPSNETICTGMITLEYSIDDLHLDETWMEINNVWTNITGQTTIDIDTKIYEDAYYLVVFKLNDTLGNVAVQRIILGIDNTPPQIQIISPINNTMIIVGDQINITAKIMSLDPNLVNIYPYKPEPKPYEPKEKIIIDGNTVIEQVLEHNDTTTITHIIDTTGWDPGDHIIEIVVTDAAGQGSRAVIYITAEAPSTATTTAMTTQPSTLSSSTSTPTTTSETSTSPYEKVDYTIAVIAIVVIIIGVIAYYIFVKKK
ncbi:MAG: hypothetical protein DRO40_00200 [Thermoprotei archaeon]|nr:MAG: hypothetical protein DRO40_00200 [Thermoprotei archaeon]